MARSVASYGTRLDEALWLEALDVTRAQHRNVREARARLERGGEVLNLPRIGRRILCALGLHDFRLVERIISFGSEGGVEKIRCTRCGLTITRQV